MDFESANVAGRISTTFRTGVEPTLDICFGLGEDGFVAVNMICECMVKE